MDRSCSLTFIRGQIKKAMKMTVAIIDNAICDLEIEAFNNLVMKFKRPMLYSAPAIHGFDIFERLDDFEALILFGSHSNVEDHLPWHGQLAYWVFEALERNIPVLGICFAHQLMAYYFGGEVEKINSPTPYQGVRSFKGLHGQFNFVVHHSYQIKDLPESFCLLGQSKLGAFDFVAHKELPFWSVQGHPEASSSFIRQNLSAWGQHPQIDEARQSGLNFIELFFNHFNLEPIPKPLPS